MTSATFITFSSEVLNDLSIEMTLSCSPPLNLVFEGISIEYSIDIPSNTKFKGGEQLKVISIDKSFNTSEEKVINVADVTPPKEPVVYPILSKY